MQGLLDSYDKGRFFCELMDCAAHDPAVQLIASRLAAMDPGELQRRAHIAEVELYNQGITFTVYSDKDAIDRILPFDLIPRVLTAREWDGLERGVRQRVAALNAFIWDVYHDQHILDDGVVPRALVLGNSNYRPEMAWLDVPHGTYVHVCGVDIIRDETGEFLVLEDNARTPSGVSYVIENRNMMRRIFPDLMDGIAVKPVGSYGMMLQAALAEIAPADVSDPQVVLLSPGIYNSAYFEHIFLAREILSPAPKTGRNRPHRRQPATGAPRLRAGCADIPVWRPPCAGPRRPWRRARYPPHCGTAPGPGGTADRRDARFGLPARPHPARRRPHRWKRPAWPRGHRRHRSKTRRRCPAIAWRRRPE